MRRPLLSLSVGLGAVALAWSAPARAQEQPLPPLPSQAPQYAPPPPPQQAPPQYYQQPPPPPPPGYGQPYYYQQPPPPPYYQPQPYPYAPPPRESYEGPPVHAPKFSLWLGARLGYIGFGGGWYGINPAYNNTGSSLTETTGNLVGNGATVEVDAGVRLGKRYIPYVFYERSFLVPGHRFDGNSNASAYSELYGVGFRYVAGDVDTAGFVTEISVGERTVAVSDGNSTYTMSALEYFKLGLGAEIRLATLFTLSPLASISTGEMTDSSGSVSFSNARDGITAPPFQNGSQINDQRGYVMVSLTIGGHFDVFGK